MFMRYMTLGLFIFCPFLLLKISYRLQLPVTIQSRKFNCVLGVMYDFLTSIWRECIDFNLRRKYGNREFWKLISWAYVIAYDL